MHQERRDPGNSRVPVLKDLWKPRTAVRLRGNWTRRLDLDSTLTVFIEEEYGVESEFS